MCKVKPTSSCFGEGGVPHTHTQTHKYENGCLSAVAHIKDVYEVAVF